MTALWTRSPNSHRCGDGYGDRNGDGDGEGYLGHGHGSLLEYGHGDGRDFYNPGDRIGCGDGDDLSGDTYGHRNFGYPEQHVEGSPVAIQRARMREGPFVVADLLILAVAS